MFLIDLLLLEVVVAVDHLQTHNVISSQDLEPIVMEMNVYLELETLPAIKQGHNFLKFTELYLEIFSAVEKINKLIVQQILVTMLMFLQTPKL